MHFLLEPLTKVPILLNLNFSLIQMNLSLVLVMVDYPRQFLILFQKGEAKSDLIYNQAVCFFLT